MKLHDSAYYDKLAYVVGEHLAKPRRRPVPFDFAVVLYTTPGGTLIIASSGNYTDSGQLRDLVAILPAPLGGSRVVPLSITVNPDLVEGLEARLCDDR